MCITRVLHDSPILSELNSFLWSDNISNAALLGRAVDWYDDSKVVQQKHDEQHAAQDTPLLPSSILHISTRAPNAMFPGGRRASAGVLVATRTHFDASIIIINTSVYYPMDAGTYQRNALINGKGCNTNQGLSGICLGETCLTTFAQECQCLNHQVPPHEVGSFFASWVKWIGGKQRGLNKYICWYDNLQNLRDASNSLWLHRHEWSVYSNHAERDYMGWNECPVTNNVRNVDLLDAIVIQLPLLQPQDYNTTTMSLCDYGGSQIQHDVVTSLETMKQMGYTTRLPVVFLTYTRGMNNEDCNQYWNGHDCLNGYQKVLFAQEFTFGNGGSCLAIPKGCRNVYYFPYNNATETCEVTSDICLNTENPTRAHSMAMINHETTVDMMMFTDTTESGSSLNRLLALENANLVPPQMPFPTIFSVFHIMAMCTVVAMILFLQATLGNRRRIQRTRAIR